MNPNYTHTITLYNCLKAADNPSQKQDVWYRTVISDCFYKAVVSRVESGGNLGMRNTYTVRIPKSDKYMPYAEWSKLPDEKRMEYFTVRIDDIVLHGDIEESILKQTGSTAAEVLQRHKPDAFKVTAFSDNSAFPVNGHYRLGG